MHTCVMHMCHESESLKQFYTFFWLTFERAVLISIRAPNGTG